MHLKTWLNKSSESERLQVADEASTTVGYLWQIAGSHREAGAKLARRIESATQKVTPGRVVQAGELRPDIFGAPEPSESAA